MTRRSKKFSWALTCAACVQATDDTWQQAMYLLVTLPSGAKMRVELFQRDGHDEGIRVSALDGVLQIHPEASNSARLSNDDYVARERRRRKPK